MLVQAAARAEADRQRKVLEDLVALRDTDGESQALRARLANQQALTRPGVGTAIRARLAELGVDEAPVGTALAKMPDDELQAGYTWVVGRRTGSRHRGYLVWKISEGLKGRVPVGAVERSRRDPGVEVRVLPLRMEAPVVEAIDAAWASSARHWRHGCGRGARSRRRSWCG